VRLAQGGPLLEFVRETIDVENALAALVLAERSADVTPKDAFLRGGSRIDIAAFEEAIATGTATGAGARLARAFGESRLAGPLARAGGDGGAAEAALLRARLAAQRGAARRDPLGPAPLLVFVLALRAEADDLRRLIWGLALDAPRTLLAAELATTA
jgi:vacuolar-type H+-ATPase subunit C/Vma6